MKKTILAGLMSGLLAVNVVHASEFDLCMNAWERALVNSEITSSEVMTNGAVAVGGTLASVAAGATTGTIKTAALFAVGATVVGGVALAANEQWDIIARFSREAQTITGSAVSQLGKALDEAGKTVSETDLQEAIKENEVDKKMARLLCNDSHRPILLGHYVEMVIQSLKNKEN